MRTTFLSSWSSKRYISVNHGSAILPTADSSQLEMDLLFKLLNQAMIKSIKFTALSSLLYSQNCSFSPWSTGYTSIQYVTGCNLVQVCLHWPLISSPVVLTGVRNETVYLFLYCAFGPHNVGAPSIMHAGKSLHTWLKTKSEWDQILQCHSYSKLNKIKHTGHFSKRVESLSNPLITFTCNKTTLFE